MSKSGQSRWMSIVEIKLGTFIGFILAWVSWVYWPVPQLFGVESSPGQGLWLTLYFTVLSVVRGYSVRRFFNWLQNKEDI